MKSLFTKEQLKLLYSAWQVEEIYPTKETQRVISFPKEVYPNTAIIKKVNMKTACGHHLYHVDLKNIEITP